MLSWEVTLAPGIHPILLACELHGSGLQIPACQVLDPPLVGERVRTTPTGYLSGLPEEEHVVPGLQVLPRFLSPLPCSWPAESAVLNKNMDILIWFNLF